MMVSFKGTTATLQAEVRDWSLITGSGGGGGGLQKRRGGRDQVLPLQKRSWGGGRKKVLAMPKGAKTRWR